MIISSIPPKFNIYKTLHSKFNGHSLINGAVFNSPKKQSYRVDLSVEAPDVIPV
jgi:hypothetical protein